MSDAAKSRAKHKWAIEKPKLDNARRLRCKNFIEPDDEEFKHTMENARRKFKIPMPPAMPSKTPVNCGEIISRNSQNFLKIREFFECWFLKED